MINSSKPVLIFWMVFALPTAIYSLAHPLFESAVKNNIYTGVTFGITIFLIVGLWASKAVAAKA